MANLTQILAETSKSYDNSRNALQNQIDAIAGDLTAQKNRINADYAQQAKTLDNQRNYQAQASSMAASRNGGSFGGANEIANKKYYQQAFVPAVTQMQTNQANDLSKAESQANSNRLSLQQTLAQLNDEANRYALQRYDNEVAAERAAAQQAAELAEKKRQFDAQMAQQNAYQQYLNQLTQPQKGYSYTTDNAGGKQFYNTATGNAVKFGTYYGANGGDYSGADLINAAKQVFGDKSEEVKQLQAGLLTGRNYAQNTGKNFVSTGNALLDRLGLKYV
jgi:hypothetical protein